MKAVRVHQFGGIDAMVYEETPRPEPGPGQVLVRVAAAGVGLWDALIREGDSDLGHTVPLTLGSDLAGIVEAVGPGVTDFERGDRVFGATNPLFINAYAEYAVADAGMIARTPERLSQIEAASVPVVAVTAWQMLFDHGSVGSGSQVLILGAAGVVGAYAVQLAKSAGANAAAVVRPKDAEYVRSLGADRVLDASASSTEQGVSGIDVVLDLVGGESLERWIGALKPGGTCVSAVALPDTQKAGRPDIKALFFYVSVTTAGLTKIAARLQSGTLTPTVGEVLPLAEARTAHEMLAGRPHQRGKIVLRVSD